MDTRGVRANIEHVNHVFNNLTKSQSYDGKVISFQTKHRNTDQDAERRRYDRTDKESDNKAELRVGNGGCHNMGKKCPGKGSHTHKTGVSQAQLPEDSHRQVQGYGKYDIGAERNENSL